MTRTTAALIALDDLIPSKGNIRSRLTNLDELAASIRVHGILQPLLVVPLQNGKFKIIAGHRRAAAAKIAGLRGVPCVVRHENKSDETALMAIENLQRENLDPIDAARALANLRDKHSITDVARMTGISAATVRARISLLDLPDEAQTMVSRGQLSLGDAVDLAKQLQSKRTGSATVGRKRTVSHFAAHHPLAKHVQTRCTHHDSNQRIMGPGCGQCWEAVIRADALGHLTNVTVLDTTNRDTSVTETATTAKPFDEATVQRICDHQAAGLRITAGDREEAVRRLVKRGLSDSQIAEHAQTTSRTVDRIRGRLGIPAAIAPSQGEHARRRTA